MNDGAGQYQVWKTNADESADRWLWGVSADDGREQSIEYAKRIKLAPREYAYVAFAPGQVGRGAMIFLRAADE